MRPRGKCKVSFPTAARFAPPASSCSGRRAGRRLLRLRRRQRRDRATAAGAAGRCLSRRRQSSTSADCPQAPPRAAPDCGPEGLEGLAGAGSRRPQSPCAQSRTRLRYDSTACTVLHERLSYLAADHLPRAPGQLARLQSRLQDLLSLPPQCPRRDEKIKLSVVRAGSRMFTIPLQWMPVAVDACWLRLGCE